MTDHIPLVTGEDGARLSRDIFGDSALFRVPLEKVDKCSSILANKATLWVDPSVDGLDDLSARLSQNKPNPWLEFMKEFPNYQKIADPAFQDKPIEKAVYTFVEAILDRCVSKKAEWITVPQLPVVGDSARNKINKSLAAATGKWRKSHDFKGRLILPIILTHQDQVNGKTERNPKIKCADRCYRDSQSDGFWIVDKSLNDDSGSATLAEKRFPGLINFHREINESIPSKIKISGPYWGLNIVLWARGLVDHPLIGIGSGYQYFVSGGTASSPSAKVALSPLRRLVGVGQLKPWLDQAIAKLTPAHPASADLVEIRKQLTLLNVNKYAREQVAKFYKTWLDTISAAPSEGRPMALFQDLSAAYALGKKLPDFEDEKTARRPESVAQSLMLSCL